MPMTERQRQIREAYQRLQNKSAVAREFGISEHTVRESLVKSQRYLDADPGVRDAVDQTGLSMVSASHGWRRIQDPDTGNWNSVFWKNDRSVDEAQTFADLVREAMGGDLPKATAVAAPTGTMDDYCTLYALTDAHVGMLAWPEETGEAWDTDIAERTIMRWMACSLELTKPSTYAVLAEIGDLLHWDGLEAVTPASRNILDADTRYQKLVRVGIRIVRALVRMMLTKHQHVHVVLAEGNHDESTSAVLREFFAVHYEDEPRVTIDQSAGGFYAYQHGETSLYFHHGHKVKPDQIDSVFASRYRQMFGTTRRSYAHLGHLHHQEIKSTNLMTVEQHPTLAAMDAFAAKRGYGAERVATAITYHRKYGEVSRDVVPYEMVSDE